jgi:uncharacterized damage-inducible protein DinB
VGSSVLSDAFAQHVWATVRVLDACRDLTDEQLATTVPGTYGSIIVTLRHTVGADASYLNLLSGGKVKAIDEEDMSLDELRAAQASYADAWEELASSSTDPATDVVRHRDDGSESHAPFGLRLVQTLQHGTDHRSQVCTALTTLGIEPPEIDVWAWAQPLGHFWIAEAPPA